MNKEVGVRMSSSLPLAERDSVREQLERILASHFFRNSKRFPRFLRYTVENALRGTEDIKERTLGIEVFGRQPDYDTSLDRGSRDGNGRTKIGRLRTYVRYNRPRRGTTILEVHRPV